MLLWNDNFLHLTHLTQAERRFSGTRATVPGLELPELDEEALDHDLNLAPHLKALKRVRLESTGACCVIRCDSEELGLLAAAYIAARHGAVYEEDMLDLEDYLRSHAPDSGALAEDRDMTLSQNGFLPVYRMDSAMDFFDIDSISDSFLTGRKARSVQVPSWHTMDTAHPLVMIPSTLNDSRLVQEVQRQTAMRSLTLVILTASDADTFTSVFGDAQSSLLSMSAELAFNFAAEVVSVERPAPACSYNRLLLTQMLREAGLQLDAHCRPQTLLKELESFRARRGGVTNDSIYKYVQLLRHLYPPTEVPVVTRQKALKPLANPLRAKTKTEQAPTVQLYGCDKVKRQLRSVVDTMRIDQERRSNHLPASRHGQVLLFAGAPGTGKTTAARLLHQWLRDEDLLGFSTDFSQGYCQVSGAQLKAPFVGQTAPMIHELFSDHPFLFIDEAYALAESGLSGANNDHFAQEAMGQLCIELENLPADHVVVFAGYGGDHDNRMRAFLNANPGLASRITQTIQFDPYSPDKELPEIFAMLVKERGLALPGRWQSVVVPYFRRRARQEDFGSGREARRLLESCLLAQSHRLVKTTNYRPAALRQLNLEDLRSAVADLEAGFQALQDARTLNCGLGVGRTAHREETEADLA